jgi:hypothetical protein
MFWLNRLAGCSLALLLLAIGVTLGIFLVDGLLGSKARTARSPSLWGAYGTLWACNVLSSDYAANWLPADLEPEQYYRWTSHIVFASWVIDLELWFACYVTRAVVPLLFLEVTLGSSSTAIRRRMGSRQSCHWGPHPGYCPTRPFIRLVDPYDRLLAGKVQHLASCKSGSTMRIAGQHGAGWPTTARSPGQDVALKPLRWRPRQPLPLCHFLRSSRCAWPASHAADDGNWQTLTGARALSVGAGQNDRSAGFLRLYLARRGAD